ncbi:hypothetical protein TH61_02825 [Rufibacter sp. DG15C]|uniref:hypothetical protein n=1 Tax=Rufibacter sp. DG15C TaxID=1379909 RepID=UPI00078CCE08|nr:hypothetical protein [Rufibacter sp. DG15C]AMM50325.1 hypothetical protein TH61_02825 [Rufibacter sp. DG15C]
MDDVYEELDALPKAFNPNDVRKLNITMSEANYKTLAGKPGVASYVNTNFYFATEEEAGKLIPLYLNTAYPNFDNKDEITVTYNLLTYSFKGNTVAERDVYTLTDEDYALGGTTFKNFDRFSQVETYLNARYPTPVQGRLVNLTFNWFSNNQLPTTQVRTYSYFYTNGRWEETYLVTEADYLKVDRNRNNAFAPADEAMLPGYFDNFLKSKVFGAKAGDVKYVSYAVRMSSSSTLQQVMAMVYDGSNWTKLTRNFFTEPRTLTFAFNNGIWVPDLTIKYTLVTADYEAIAAFPNVGTELNRANLKQFKNFYQAGSTTDTRYWTEAQINAGLAELLKVKYPNAEVGQKYQLTYIVYRGSNVTVQTTFIKKDNGSFEVFK